MLTPHRFHGSPGNYNSPCFPHNVGEMNGRVEEEKLEAGGGKMAAGLAHHNPAVPVSVTEGPEEGLHKHERGVELSTQLRDVGRSRLGGASGRGGGQLVSSPLWRFTSTPTTAAAICDGATIFTLMWPGDRLACLTQTSTALIA